MVSDTDPISLSPDGRDQLTTVEIEVKETASGRPKGGGRRRLSASPQPFGRPDAVRLGRRSNTDRVATVAVKDIGVITKAKK